MDESSEEIEVTPEMIEAGIRALSHWDDDDENNLSRAYVAMEKARRDQLANRGLTQAR